MLKTAEEIIQYIGNAKKQTPVKVYINGHDLPKAEGFKMFGTEDSKICIGDLDAIRTYLEENKDKITETYMEQDRRNSAIPMIDMTNINARIEPGCFIREHVTIGDNAVIMMGAVINIGAKIGEGSMIDMGAVLGGRAEVGKHCHVGAGAVLAGVIRASVLLKVILLSTTNLSLSGTSVLPESSPRVVTKENSRKSLFLSVSLAPGLPSVPLLTTSTLNLQESFLSISSIPPSATIFLT